MNTPSLIRLALIMVLCLASIASAQTTAFTYQGHLMDNGASANGNYDIQFTLKNNLTGGSTVGVPQTIAPVTAVNGIFTVTLDFLSTPFALSPVFLEVAVRPFGSAAAYTVLAPRQRFTASPFAIRAVNSTSAQTATQATALLGTLTASNVPANLITSTMLANGAVGSSQLAAGSVGVTQLAPDTITTSGRLAQAGVVNEAEMTFVFNRASFTKDFTSAFPATPVVTLGAQGGTGTPWFESAWVETVNANSFSGRLTVPLEHTTLVTQPAGGSSGIPAGTLVNGMPAVLIGSGTTGSDTRSISFSRLSDPATKTWTTTAVTSGISHFIVSNLCEVNGAPAFIFTFQSFVGGPVIYGYMRAGDANGTTWSGAGASFGTLSPGTTLQVVNGNPAVCYEASSTLSYKRAPTPTGSGTWSTGVVVDTGFNSNRSLITADGRPAIVYTGGSSGGIGYVLASDANGDAWGTPVTLASGGQPSAVTLGGTPMVVFLSGTNSGSLHFKSALDSQGSSWGPTMVLDATTDCSGPVLTSINGKPAIRYTRGSNPATQQVYYIEAMNAAASQWSEPVKVPTADPTGSAYGGPLFVDFSGKPFLSQVTPANTYLVVRPSPLPASYKVNWIALPP